MTAKKTKAPIGRMFAVRVEERKSRYGYTSPQLLVKFLHPNLNHHREQALMYEIAARICTVSAENSERWIVVPETNDRYILIELFSDDRAEADRALAVLRQVAAEIS